MLKSIGSTVARCRSGEGEREGGRVGGAFRRKAAHGNRDRCPEGGT
jgi:hypothetical protein